MSDQPKDQTLMAPPPISASTRLMPQDTLLQRGAFDPPVVAGTVGRLDRFEILRMIGEGGMGQVFLAREPLTGTQVAVKVLKPRDADNPQAVRRFLTEARHMYQLSHPRILRVLEVSDRKEGPFYVMPYIAGGNLLTQYSPGKPMPRERILAIARQVAAALAYSHSRGIIHRDLKPANVLLDAEDNTYLTDFGLVRTVFNDSLVDAASSQLEGTAPYMSPAVACGEAEDTRCDIYAFGALLYELLTGQPPYAGRTPQIVLDQVVKGPPKPILEVNPKADPALVKVAENCLARELRNRYASMKDVVADLDRVARREAPLGLRRPRVGNRWLRVAAAVVVVLAVAALGGLARHALDSRTFQVADPQPSAAAPAGVQALAPDSGVPPQSANDSAPTPAEQGPFTYTFDNGAVTITKYTGPGGAVVIPAEIDGLPVTSLGYCAFSRGDLNSVTIPDGVTNIITAAFWNCEGLTSITIPKSVSQIAGNAFSRCFRLNLIKVEATNPNYCSTPDGVVFNKAKTKLIRYPSGRAGNYVIPPHVTSIGRDAFTNSINLTAMKIPASVTNIEDYAFAGCNKLTNVVLPESIVSIGEGVFADCGSLTGMTIPKSITHIGNNAFLNCGGLLSVEIPASVTNIVGNPFSRCGKLTSFVVDAENPAYCTMDGVLLDKRGTHLVGYPGGKSGSYRVPDGVEEINPATFSGCAFLPSVTLPVSVTRVGRDAFARCGALTAVYFNGNAPWVDENVFADSLKVTVYYRPGTTGWGVTFGGRPTAVWANAPADAGATAAKTDGPFTYTVKDGAVTITKYTGPGGDIAIPVMLGGHQVTSIGTKAFEECTNLTSVSIPNGVTSIGFSAFWGCARLSSVTIPDDVAHVEYG